MLRLMKITQKLRPNSTNQYPWKLAVVLYFIAWGPSLLFLKARFWDDWAIYFSMTPADQKIIGVEKAFRRMYMRS
jgi:hypothetical protein